MPTRPVSRLLVPLAAFMVAASAGVASPAPPPPPPNPPPPPPPAGERPGRLLAVPLDAPVPSLPGPGVGSFPGGACSSSSAIGQGDIAGTGNTICVGAGLTFVAPAIGQVASVIGPTIIGPGVVGAVNVSAGNVGCAASPC